MAKDWNQEHIWDPFSCNPRTLNLILGAIWNFSKEQGAPLSCYQIMGHKEPGYKAYVHRDRKGPNPNANQSIPKDKAAGTWNITTHIHSVPRIWLSAAVAPCPYIVLGRTKRRLEKGNAASNFTVSGSGSDGYWGALGGGKISTV